MEREIGKLIPVFNFIMQHKILHTVYKIVL